MTYEIVFHLVRRALGSRVFFVFFQSPKAEEELDRLSKTMGFMEKGKIRVRGLLEPEAVEAPMPAAPATPSAVAVEEPAASGTEAAPQETEA